MNKWKLVSDSSSDLTSEEHAQYFSVPFVSAPLIVKVENTEYVDIYTTDPVKMTEHIRRWGKPCTTSCPSVSEYLKAFEDGENIICVTISSALSGSYNSALQAKNIALEEHPEKKIDIVDSRSTAGNMQLILRFADELIKSGENFDEITKKLDEYRDNMKIVFSLACFDNLINAGRMNKITGIIASALNIRPLASNSSKGTIDVIEKPRGEKKAMERLVVRLGEYKKMDGLTVIISHCQNESAAMELKSMILSTYNVKAVEVWKTRCLTSYYSDVGSLLVAF